jgi:hypothetical protein
VMLPLLLAMVAVAPAYAAATPPSPARACVQIAPALAETLVSRGSLVEALRARLQRRGVHVVDCATAKALDWRVSVEASDPTTIEFTIDGPQVAVRQHLNTGERAPEAIVQLLAVSIAEALRPVLDALLDRLGDAPPRRDELDDALARMTASAPPEPQAADREAASAASVASSTAPDSELKPPTAVPPGLLRSELGLGVLLAPETPRLQTSARGALVLQAGPLALALHAATGAALAARVAGFGVNASQMRIGGSVQWSSRLMDVGLGGQARYSRISLAGAGAMLKREPATAWDGGLLLVYSVWPWGVGPLQLGACAEVSLWWHPLRVRVRGETVMRQSFVDAELGPVARFTWQ